MYNKAKTKEFIDKPVILAYRWNGSQNIITGKIKESNYYIKFRKIESKNTIKIRYSQIDNIELMPEISENYMIKYEMLKKQAEKHISKGENKEAIIKYKEILEIIRPGTIKANRIKSCILDCEINDSLSDGSMELRDKLKTIK